MPVVYTAVEKFDAGCGNRWQKYVEWSGLTQLRKVISLDLLLCSNIFRNPTAEDWQHNVHESFKTHLFCNVDHVLNRVAGDQRTIVLALMENPTAADIESFHDSRFELRGFDLVELETGISALVNCGGFDKAFAPEELSDCGLLTNYGRALEVKERLRVEYPDEPHADCDMWAVWERRTGPTLSV